MRTRGTLVRFQPGVCADVAQYGRAPGRQPGDARSIRVVRFRHVAVVKTEGQTLLAHRVRPCARSVTGLWCNCAARASSNLASPGSTPGRPARHGPARAGYLESVPNARVRIPLRTSVRIRPATHDRDDHLLRVEATTATASAGRRASVISLVQREARPRGFAPRQRRTPILIPRPRILTTRRR